MTGRGMAHGLMMGECIGLYGVWYPCKSVGSPTIAYDVPIASPQASLLAKNDNG